MCFKKGLSRVGICVTAVGFLENTEESENDAAAHDHEDQFRWRPALLDPGEAPAPQ